MEKFFSYNNSYRFSGVWIKASDLNILNIFSNSKCSV